MDWIDIKEFWYNKDYDDAKKFFYFLLKNGNIKRGFIRDFENIAIKYATEDVVF